MIDYALLFEAAAGCARTALATADAAPAHVTLAAVEIAAIHDACEKLATDEPAALTHYTRQHAIPYPMPRRTPVAGPLEDMRKQARANMRAAAQRERQSVDVES